MISLKTVQQCPYFLRFYTKGIKIEGGNTTSASFLGNYLVHGFGEILKIIWLLEKNYRPRLIICY